MDTLETQKKLRGNYKTQLTKFANFVHGLDKSSPANKLILAKLEFKQRSADEYFKLFDAIQIDIEDTLQNDELDEALTYRSEVEDTYFGAIVLSKQLTEQLTRATSANSNVCSQTVSSVLDNNSNCSNRSQVKLPTIELPKFNGNFEDWLEFKAKYESMIHNNDALDNIEKFHYLRACLLGSAQKIITALEFNSNNYTLAWESLENRYSKSGLLIFNHVKALHDLPKVHATSASNIRDLVDSITKHLHCLKTLGEPVNSWDTLLLFLFVNKLEISLINDWETEKQFSQQNTVSAFIKFLEKKAEFLDTLLNRTEQPKKAIVLQKKAFVTNKSYICYNCQEDHSIFKCEQFRALSVSDKLLKIQKLQLCENCFNKGHKAFQCKRYGCRICKKKHNIILHPENKVETVTVNCSRNNCGRDVLLATAYVYVTDNKGNKHYARALLDNGAEPNFITSNLFTLLNLSTDKVPTQINAFGNLSTSLNEVCTLNIQSTHSDYHESIRCYVAKELTDKLPSCTLKDLPLKCPKHLKLADPEFFKPSKIDLLLGGGVFWKILGNEHVLLDNNGLRLQETKLGWIVAGPLPVLNTYNKVNCHFATYADVKKQLQKFWEVEEVFIPDANLSDTCEIHFKQTTTRSSDGKFIVKYPLCMPVENLTDSKTVAIKRFKALERKFLTNSAYKEQYCAFMNEYLTMNHMSLLKQPVERIFYLPHHGVVREESTTTKLRVVFDGSAKGDNGYSFNEIQHTGPKLQQDLLAIIIRFRQHKVVIGGDVEKMYRQIWIADEQRPYQAILWRSNSNSDIETYLLNTVTYGTTSAPYLAIRCLQELGHIHKVNNPKISKLILEDFYVDDMLTGGDSVTEVLDLAKEVSDILNTASFRLRKWVSNSEEILNCFENTSESFSFGNKSESKVLGIRWMCKSDMLFFKINLNTKAQENTKRAILSCVSQIFDPLGLLSPVMTTIKHLLQELWLDKLEWDDEIPINLKQKWEVIRAELPLLNSVEIPRWVMTDNVNNVQLHGFSDASEIGIGCCIYIRCKTEMGNITVKLLCAKSKVAPIKTVSIPRLELAAALLLSELVNVALKSLTINFNSIHLWSDSTIVLHWLSTNPNLLQTYIANRVAKIQNLTRISDWKHIRTADNSADIITRGLQPSQLCENVKWWNGVPWLKEKQKLWPSSILKFTSDPPELKKKVYATQIISCKSIINFDRYSKYTRIVRVTSYILRFFKNCKNLANQQYGPLLPTELNEADLKLVYLSQMESFADEIKLLKEGKALSRSLQKLSPELDTSGIIRVGGRINTSLYSFMKRHPVLLCSKHKFTKLIFENLHEKYFHLGPTALLAQVRERYWPVSGRSLARQVVSKCIQCFKINPKFITPIMSNLPNKRVEPAFPFSIVGVDYGGPISIRDKRGRNCKFSDAYFAIFICFATKAIHIETVTSLSTDSFIAALRRFTSRRGCPTHIYSDNGRNFVGANKELAKLTRLLISDEVKLQTQLSIQGINWHFIPPYSPHFGGLWERGIRSIKYHLKRVMINVKFTFEELTTVLTQIEAILNSRPLCPILPWDPNDYEPLTPSHFLIGKRLNCVADVNVTEIPISRLKLYERIQLTVQLFWVRWKKEYISELQIKQKWTTSSGQLNNGDTVLLKNEQVPPACWKMGRISNLFKGKDGVARVAEIQTVNGKITRSFSRICPLPNLKD